MNFTVRRATADDENFIKDCFRASTKEDRQAGRNASRLGPFMPQAERDAIATQDVLILTRHNDPAGFARFYRRRDNVATLHKLFVGKDFRSQGGGARLITVFAAEAKEVGIGALRVTLPDPALLAFYERQGFQETRLVPRPGKGPLIIMERTLAS